MPRRHDPVTTDRPTTADLGAYLRTARERAGLDTRQLAHLLGVQPARLTWMERGALGGMDVAAEYLGALEALGVRLKL